MIYVLKPTIANNVYLRLAGIFTFALLTGLAAQISIQTVPVPITLQVLPVLLAGLTLGSRDGFMSQATYLSLILVGFPIAANGVGGLEAFTRPSTGYLYAFPIAAGVVGLLATRKNFATLGLACLAGVVVIYTLGTVYLKWNLNATWEQAWEWGVQPFIAFDMAKALVAITSGELLRQWFRQYPE